MVGARMGTSLRRGQSEGTVKVNESVWVANDSNM